MKLAGKILLALVVLALVILRAEEPFPRQDTGFYSISPLVFPSGGPAPPAEPQAPPRLGETLTYQVSWSSFATAATATISVPERMYFYGTNVWHIEAAVSTANPVRRLFAVDDKFVSYSNVRTMASLYYAMNLHEMGRNHRQRFRPVQPGTNNPGGEGTAVNVPQGTVDPLGALFLVRMAAWKHPLSAHVFDGRQIYTMTAEKAAAEAVSTPVGNFTADRVNIALRVGSADASPLALTVWLTQDVRRTPVAIEASLPFGSLRAELTSGAASH
jgi:hypothetical protein